MTIPDRPIIRSRSNPAVKRLVRLRDNRRRRKAGCFLVDGWRETRRAIESGLTPSCVYSAFDLDGAEVATLGSDQPDAGQDESGSSRSLAARGTNAGLFQLETETVEDADAKFVLNASPQVQPVTQDVLRCISYGQNSRQVVAEFEEPNRSLETLPLAPDSTVLVLDSIEKPGNIGAVFRSADAAGVAAVVLTGAAIDLFNPNAIRSSLGTIFTVPSAVAPRDQLEPFLRKRGFSIFAARVQSSKSLWEVSLKGAVAVVLGNEATGLGESWSGTREAMIQGIRIPMLGHADSLNLSVSAAVIAFEVARRRESSG
ncbi:MAG: TrmH family RNA methyltransferase [Planctomycetota bacterium]